MIKIFRIICFTLFFASFIHTQAEANDSLEVVNAMQKFLHAFNNLEWETFRNSFAKDATIFYPVWEEAKRRSGKNEIEETWIKLFPEFTDPLNTFKLSITPKDLFIQLYYKTAIVTFHLGEGNNSLYRRTIVFVKEKEDWKIVHLHASKSIKETD